MKKSLIVFALLAVAGRPVLCQTTPKPMDTKATEAKSDPIDTDRGNFTNGPGIVPKGSYQIETGYTLARINGAHSQALGEVLFRIPLTPVSEFRVGLNSYQSITGDGNSAHGFQDISLGYKRRLIEQKGSGGFGPPAVAINFSATLPTGSEVFTEKMVQPSALLILSRDITEKFSLGANLGYGWLSSGGQHFSQFIASTSGQFKINAKTSAFLEYIGFLPGGYRGSNASFIDTGIFYLVSDAIQLDARIGKGFSGASPDDFGGFGISFRWH
ncbi:MAG: transporter [Chthonomonadales bacterium]